MAARKTLRQWVPFVQKPGILRIAAPGSSEYFSMTGIEVQGWWAVRQEEMRQAGTAARKVPV